MRLGVFVTDFSPKRLIDPKDKKSKIDCKVLLGLIRSTITQLNFLCWSKFENNFIRSLN